MDVGNAFFLFPVSFKTIGKFVGFGGVDGLVFWWFFF